MRICYVLKWLSSKRLRDIPAFHLIPLDESSQLKTVVLTQWGAYKFKKLAMGLRNAAQSFQRLMDHVLQGLEDVFCYMDDVLIFSKDENAHQKTLKELNLHHFLP